MIKPLSVTSPNHAVALSTYFILGFFGFLGVFNVGKQSSIFLALGEGISDVWATTLMIGGWGALAAALGATRARRPEHNMRLEKIFCVALFLNFAYLSWVVFHHFGEKGFFTLMCGVAFSVGCGLRVVQLWFERRKIIKSRQHPQVVTPEVLADPNDTDR